MRPSRTASTSVQPEDLTEKRLRVMLDAVARGGSVDPIDLVLLAADLHAASEHPPMTADQLRGRLDWTVNAVARCRVDPPTHGHGPACDLDATGWALKTSGWLTAALVGELGPSKQPMP